MDLMHSTPSMYYDYDAHVKGELLVIMKNSQSVNLLIFISNTLIELFNDFGSDRDGILKRPTMYFNLWRYKVVRHRITTTTEVPLRKPIALENETPKPVVTLVYSRKPRKSKTNVPVCKSKVVQIVLWYSKFGNDTWQRLLGYSVISLGMLRFQGFYSRMMASSPICLLSKASKTKSWLWHRRLSHLNFGAINHLDRHGHVRGLPKLKFEKDHLCSACAMGKIKKKPYKPKSEDTNQEKLFLLHMDLCGLMRVTSVNGKKLKVPVQRIRTDNGTEFAIQTLREYYKKVCIYHETSVARSPQQNGVVERRNRTLIEVARTMLIYAKAPLFLWAEAVATTCYTQNRSIVRLRHGKTPYELLHDKLPDLSFFHVFGALMFNFIYLKYITK
ncbi:retrovirus-related pol polyprotein from transposon TNT 1-94 [Tanacetum coccineum]